MSRKILVLSNMYPSESYPYYGIFVKNTTEILYRLGFKVKEVYIEKQQNKLFKFLNYIIFYFKSFIYCFFKYDYIYIHFASLSSLSVICANRIRKVSPIIVNLHGNDLIPDLPKDEKRIKYTKKILSIADKIIVPSRYFKDYLESHYTNLTAKVYIYPSSGIDTNIFSKSATQYYCDFGLDSNYKYLGYISRLEKDKGWDIFLEAFKKISVEHPDYRAIVVGSGDEYNQFQSLLEKLNLCNKVIHFPLMSQKEIAKLFNLFDLFCLPTHRKSESLSLVGLEAMACQCIVLASDFGGPKTYIKDGVNGFLFNPSSVEDLISKFNYINTLTKSEIDLIKRNALVTIEDYDIKKMKYKLELIIND